MTKQEIFNKAYLGLKSQGFQQSANSTGDCLYNGPDNTHCAIGWIVSTLPEGCNIAQIIKSRSTHLEILGDWDHIDSMRPFLKQLQHAHDVGYTPSLMQQFLKDVAGRFEVEVPE